MPQRHILLLDPNHGNRRNLAFLLRLAGYRVTEVGAGDEALNRLALCSADSAADLLLVCLGEPGVDLGELLHWRRRRQLPLLIVSEEVAVLERPTPAAMLASCRRREVIETLAGLWTAPLAFNPDSAPMADHAQES